jgi:integrase
VVERGGLENRCGPYGPPRVRIPPPPLDSVFSALGLGSRPTAMRLLHAGVDTTVFALWLGHEHGETTQMYRHADLALKERELARTKPLDSKPGRHRPPEALLRFLDGL